MIDACLDDETIVALAEGALDGRAREAALGHLESCAMCSALVGQAARLGSTDRPSLGRYQMIEQLGAGGMGRVYLAYDPALDRELALKLVDVDALDPGVGSTRLVEEAKTLAGLDHPAICRVFDVQQHEGTVFIAMELVRGSTFATWLARRPDPAAILSAFVRAAEGLAAAHEAGVVHRDFKPSNAMIDDELRTERVVVLDFGLARREQPIDADPGETTVHDVGRRTGSAFAGTPVYMAPEQYEGIATAASDQYAFCLALVEGIAGRFPFADRGVKALRKAKLERAWLDDVVQSLPANIRAAVLRGLEPDPRARWPSMRALSNALVGPPKRRWPVTAAAAIVCAVGVGTAWAITRPPAVQCERADHSVSVVWNETRRATLREAFAAAMSRDLGSRIEAAVDEHAIAIATAYRDACAQAQEHPEESHALFDARARCLDRRVRELDAAVGALRELDEDTASSAVALVDELTDVARCRDDAFLLALTPGPDDPRSAAAVEALERELDRADGELRVGRYREAQPIFEHVVEQAKELEYDPLTAKAVAGLAVSLRKLDDPRAAEMAEEAHTRARMVGDYTTAATAAIELVHIKRRLGRMTEASEWVEEADLDAERADAPKLRAHALQARASIAHAKNEIEDALALHREALAIHAELDPNGRGYALTLKDVASELRRLERFDEAIEALRESRAILVGIYGENSARLTEVEAELGTVYLVEGDPAAAIPYLERAREFAVRKSGERSRAVLSTKTALTAAYRDAGRLADAAEQAREAIALLGHMESGPRDEALVWMHYAKTLHLQGELDAALEAYDKCLGLLGSMEEDAAQRDMTSMNLDASADVLEQLGRGEEAARARERARALSPPQ